MCCMQGACTAASRGLTHLHTLAWSQRLLSKQARTVYMFVNSCACSYFVPLQARICASACPTRFTAVRPTPTAQCASGRQHSAQGGWPCLPCTSACAAVTAHWRQHRANCICWVGAATWRCATCWVLCYPVTKPLLSAVSVVSDRHVVALSHARSHFFQVHQFALLCLPRH